jgi:hypothetical protein
VATKRRRPPHRSYGALTRLSLSPKPPAITFQRHGQHEAAALPSIFPVNLTHNSISLFLSIFSADPNFLNLTHNSIFRSTLIYFDFISFYF